MVVRTMIVGMLLGLAGSFGPGIVAAQPPAGGIGGGFNRQPDGGGLHEPTGDDYADLSQREATLRHQRAAFERYRRNVLEQMRYSVGEQSLRPTRPSMPLFHSYYSPRRIIYVPVYQPLLGP